MALAKVVAKLEDVAESHRSLYVADGDKFKLDLDGDEDNGALWVELATAKREAVERRMAIKALEEKFTGSDPVKVKEMLAKLDKNVHFARDHVLLVDEREAGLIEHTNQLNECLGQCIALGTPYFHMSLQCLAWIVSIRIGK